MTDPMKLVSATGQALYGPLWQSELARDLGLTDRTVRRWLAGDTSPPEDIGPRLRSIIDKRMNTLRKVRRALPT